MTTLKQVEEFHKVFDHPILETPTIPSPTRCNLRANLLQEELDELKEAIAKADIVEVADALADLQYVLNGAVLEFGLKNKFHELCNEVHRSNMSKAYDSYAGAEFGRAYHEQKTGETVEIKKYPDGTYVTFRESDGKVLKNPRYSPANLRSIVESE